MLLAILTCCFPLLAKDGNIPERQVHENVLTSERDPKIRIELPKQVQYVGADRWVLFGVADCELHLFVEADVHKFVRRLFWIQFEGYLPSQPELKHTYPMTHTRTLGGMLFDVRARFGSSDEKPKPGSDLEHLQALLKTKGYKLPEAMMNVRFVHLLDERKRKELMIIYAEDLKPAGLTVNDLNPGGSGSSQWPRIENDLIERAGKSLSFTR